MKYREGEKDSRGTEKESELRMVTTKTRVFAPPVRILSDVPRAFLGGDLSYMSLEVENN